jgi:hypothetical protein
MAGLGAQRATSLNKDSIGHRYIELFRIGRDEALDRLGFGGGGGGGFDPHGGHGAMRQVGRE